MDQTSPRKSSLASKTSVPSPLIVPKAFKSPEMYTSPTDSIMSPVLKDLLARTKSKKSSTLIQEHHKIRDSKFGDTENLMQNEGLEVIAEGLGTLKNMQIVQALAADKFEQMWMNKEYEYSMNVLSFQIQTSYLLSNSEVVDRLLTEVLDDALLKLISTSIGGVNQAMVVAANMAVLERACDFFFRHAAKLSGIPLRMVERSMLREARTTLSLRVYAATKEVSEQT
ncbi:exocyst complex component SEC15B, partial [Tanacetum coccineum]